MWTGYFPPTGATYLAYLHSSLLLLNNEERLYLIGMLTKPCQTWKELRTSHLECSDLQESNVADFLQIVDAAGYFSNSPTSSCQNQNERSLHSLGAIILTYGICNISMGKSTRSIL